MTLRLPADSWGDELACPSCGETYLHHTAVEMFERPNEDLPGSIVTVGIGGAVTKQAAEGRFLVGRRNAIRIWFYCEQCDIRGDDDDENTIPGYRARRVLQIVQHKGQTYVAWLASDDLPPGEDDAQ